jgi:phosphatidylinositol dimannoside acyltransferase
MNAVLQAKRELRDLVELVLVPGLAAVLPWRWCYALFKLLSHWSWLYRDAARITFEQAHSRGFASDPEDWGRKWRQMSMVDHADFFLAATRSNRWLDHYVDVSGSWPEPGKAAIICAFHWGAGMWSLRHLGASGLHVHALVASLGGDPPPGERVRHTYFRYRNALVRRALGTQPLDVSASLRPVLEALRAGEQVGTSVDVPPHMTSASSSIPFLGGRARFPRGLFRIATAHDIPVSVYLTGISLEDGRRFIRVFPTIIESDSDALMQKVFCRLEDAIREEPALWHFWGMAGHFFE